MAMTRQEAINDALERLQGIGFTMEPGFSEHGPMVAEAIASLGRLDRIADWVDAYRAHYRHIPVPPPRAAIDLNDETGWRVALGDSARVADWLDAFRSALWEEPWQDVIRRWVPRLMDGYAGGLTHGLLRTAHAIRGFPENDLPSLVQRDELAHGLAYWAANYHRAAGDSDRRGTQSLADALHHLPRGSVDPAALAASIGSLGDMPDIDLAISQHTSLFGRVLLAQHSLPPVPLIQLVHSITAVVATRTFLPHLPPDFGAWAYRRLWQASAALVARLARMQPPQELDNEIPPPALSRDALIDAAIAHRDDHVIKLTEACLREDAIRPDPVYRAVAETVLRRIPAWQ